MWMLTSSCRTVIHRHPPGSSRGAMPVRCITSRAMSPHSASVRVRSPGATRTGQCHTIRPLTEPSRSAVASSAGVRRRHAATRCGFSAAGVPAARWPTSSRRAGQVRAFRQRGSPNSESGPSSTTSVAGDCGPATRACLLIRALVLTARPRSPVGVVIPTLVREWCRSRQLARPVPNTLPGSSAELPHLRLCRWSTPLLPRNDRSPENR